MSLPASTGQSTPRDHGPAVDGTGQAGRGLTAMIFDNGVEFREEAEPPARRASRARRKMTAALSSEGRRLGGFFWGFRFEEGRMTATSADAQYQVAKGTVAVEGWNRLATEGCRRTRHRRRRQIDVTLSPRVLVASGTVRSELAAGRKKEGQRGNTLLSEKESVIVTANELRFEEGSGSGVYKGQAHLFQASGTSIRGDEIAMNEEDGTLTATGNVVSVLPIAGRKAAPAAPPRLRAPANSSSRTPSAARSSPSRRSSMASRATCTPIASSCSSAANDNALERLEAQTTVEIVARQAQGHRPAPDLSPGRRKIRADRITGAAHAGMPGIHRPHFDLL